MPSHGFVPNGFEGRLPDRRSLRTTEDGHAGPGEEFT